MSRAPPTVRVMHATTVRPISTHPAGRRPDRTRDARPRRGRAHRRRAPGRPRPRRSPRSSPSGRPTTARRSSSVPCGSACSPSRTPASRSTSTSSGPSSRSSAPGRIGQREGRAGARADPAGQLRRRRRPPAADAREVPRRPRRAATMVEELFDETKRDSAIGRIGTMLERYFDGDASKLALLLDPTRLNSPMHQFRQEMAAGFKSLEERLVAIEAAAAARGAERARSAAKGGDFEDLLEAMLGDLARGAGDLLDRTGTEAGALLSRRRATSSCRSTRGSRAAATSGSSSRRRTARCRCARCATSCARPRRTAARRVGGRHLHAGPRAVRGRAVRPVGDDVYCVIDPDDPDPATLEAASGSPACWRSPRSSSTRSRSTPRRSRPR